MRGKAQRAARPAQTRLQNSGVTEPNFTKLLSDVEKSSTVLMYASISRSSHLFGMPAHSIKVGRPMPICYVTNSSQKSTTVTITTYLERSRKEGQIDHVHSYNVHPENLVKIIGPQ